MPDLPLSYGPRRASVLVLALLGVVLGAAGVGTDAAGALLALPAGAVALALATRDLVHPAVLSADADGIALVRGLRREHVPWSGVERLRLVRDRRTTLLEVDLGDGLHVLSRGRLGRDPREVLTALEHLRPAGERRA